MAKTDENPEQTEQKNQEVADQTLQQSHQTAATALEGTETLIVPPETQQPQFDNLLTQDAEGLTDLHGIMKQNTPQFDILPEDFEKYTVAGQLANMPEKKSVGQIKPGDRGAIK